ncbi:MAG: isochorismate synthase [Myxococcota bacterium]|nr:isochorismate synthase [Myxococcota bacterium]MDW8363608.1 isochorismate synthase [Myxococcales bacterium]
MSEAPQRLDVGGPTSLDGALEAAARRGHLLRVVEPIAPIDPLRLFVATHRHEAERWAWLSSMGGGRALVAAGLVDAVELHGPRRFEDAARWTVERLRRIETFEGAMRGPVPPPTALVGMAFAVGTASREPWNGWGDGRVVLPRWLVESKDGRCTLSILVDPRRERCRASDLRDALETMRHALSHASPDLDAAAPTLRTLDDGEASFLCGARELLGELETGRIAKAVLARCERLELDRAVPTETLAARLREQQSGCTTFAIERGAARFVGASPERLLVCRDGRVQLDALAGTRRAEPTAQRTAWLPTPKERREHALVVQHLEHVLRRSGARLDRRSQPTVRVLRDVRHLHTTLRATLPDGLHPLVLAGRLAPTPAVCGTPTDVALDRLVALEPIARGWYAGTVGWVDAHGDAELTVALRCALLEPTCAWAWAAAGIVPGSEPEAELDETRAKMRAVRRALGAAD